MSWLKQGVIVIVVLLLVFGFLGCVTSSSNNSPSVAPPTATATVTAKTVATVKPVAKPTVKPTATPVATPEPTAQPTAQPTAAPSGPAGEVGTPLTSDQLSAFDSMMTAKGYTVITPLAQKGDTADHFPMYQGMMTKDGYVFVYTIVQTDSPSHAQAEFQNAITISQGMGYSGSTQGDGSWYGTKVSDSGNPQAALVMPPGDDNTVIQLMGE